MTGRGEYILAPVVHAQTKENARADIQSDGSVTISGGRMNTDTRMGMDVNGNMGVGLEMRSDMNVDIDSTGKVIIGGTNAR